MHGHLSVEAPDGKKLSQSENRKHRICSSRFNCCFSMPVPPAAANTMQAVEELVKQCVQREVSTLQKSLDELAQDHKKALEENLSLRRTVGKLEQQLAKLCQDNGLFRQTLHRIVEKVHFTDDSGDQIYDKRLISLSQGQIPPVHLPSPPQRLACSSSLSCAQTQVSPHLPSSPDGTSTINATLPARTPSNCNILPDIVLQTVDPEVEEKIFCVTKHRYGPRRPDDYAAKMFMMIVDFATYLSWAHKVNWNGSDGKQGLPRNVIIKLRELLQRRFANISDREWKDVRDRVNERLRNPRKVDPRTVFAETAR